MKAVCIIGSPHREGSTALLVNWVAEGMRARGITVQCHVLGELNLHYCQGCKSCEQTRRCCQRDDMDILIRDMLEADILVLASPSYWGDVTGQMKVFIDRSLPLCNAKTGETLVPKGKQGIGLAIRAGQSPAENQHLISTFRHYFGHLGIEMVASLTVEGIDDVSDLEARSDKMEAAYQIGRTGIPHLSAG